MYKRLLLLRVVTYLTRYESTYKKWYTRREWSSNQFQMLLLLHMLTLSRIQWGKSTFVNIDSIQKCFDSATTKKAKAHRYIVMESFFTRKETLSHFILSTHKLNSIWENEQYTYYMCLPMYHNIVKKANDSMYVVGTYIHMSIHFCIFLFCEEIYFVLGNTFWTKKTYHIFIIFPLMLLRVISCTIIVTEKSSMKN